MSFGLLDVLGRPGINHIFGVAPAVVVDDADPEGLGRVRLSFPWHAGAPADDPLAGASAWARVAVPMAAADAGVAFRLAVGDDVLVAFEQGDIRFPYVIGGLWGRGRQPPETEPGVRSEVQVIRSRTGHVVRLVDTPGAEQIEIRDSAGELVILLDTAHDRLAIQGIDIEIQAADRLTLTGAEIVIQGKGQVAISSGAELEMSADGPLRITGAIVDIN
jgi:uncharacterized protein involved in type VI secretion and phage assembly